MRVLCFLQPGTNSRSIFQGLIRGFARAGHEPLVLELEPLFKARAQPGADPARLATLAAAELARLCREHRPDASIAMWGNALTTFAGSLREGVPVSAFDILDLPHICYWLDAPHWASQSTWLPFFRHPMLRAPRLTHVINNAATAREMTDILGFGPTHALPYAIDDETFRPFPERRDHDLAVSVGPGDPDPTPAELAALGDDQPDMPALRAARAALALARLARAGGVVGAAMPLLEPLARAHAASPAMPLLDRLHALAARDESLAPLARALVGDPAAFATAAAIIRESRAFERAFTVCWLARRCSVLAFGAMSPAWPFGGTRLGEVPFEDMPRHYCRATAALNVMRWQDEVGINLKPYESAAAGVPCLIGERLGLDAHFEPGREILPFTSPPHALDLLRTLRDSPAEREAIAANARARVQRDHTWRTRAEQLLALVHR
ncbi:MAG: glycosyltransferase [Planctomycetota bacterium]|nr:glycosyltransferase [Planctomycetota bacterium]